MELQQSREEMIRDVMREREESEGNLDPRSRDAMIIEFTRKTVLNDLFEDRDEGGDEILVGSWIGDDHRVKEDQGGRHHRGVYQSDEEGEMEGGGGGVPRSQRIRRTFST
jgi:hypothetical protein